MKRTPLPKVNRARQKRRKDAGEVYGPLHEWTKRQPCVLEEAWALHTCGTYFDRDRIESHHLVSVGAGGRDRENVLACCPALHDEFHRLGLVRMCEKYAMDFMSLATYETARYEASL